MALSKFKSIIILAISFQLLQVSVTTTQNVTAVLCQASLPSGRLYISTLYDGDDTVYLFGGSSESGALTDVLKYSISQVTIEPAGQLPTTCHSGSTIMDKHKNIYHFGLYQGTDILQYFPESQSFTKVGSLPNSNYGVVTIMLREDNFLLLGGYEDPSKFLSLDLTTLKSEEIGEMPPGLNYYLCAIWVEEKNTAYIFGGSSGFKNVTKFDKSTNHFHTLQNHFPERWSYSQSVWDGAFGYILGVFLDGEVADFSIVRFDSTTEDSKIIHIKAYPRWESARIFATSPVYIEKLNRIYMFGGAAINETGHQVYQNVIWYVSLDFE